jgi:hypothetical protein
MGMLTNNGYNMAVHLGRQLRERYILKHRLLPARYGSAASSAHDDPSSSGSPERSRLHPARSYFPASSNGLLAETTASQRTLLTLQGVLSGMYPAGNVSNS